KCYGGLFIVVSGSIDKFVPSQNAESSLSPLIADG
ncbi:unnamed protein product, partial [Rotaria sp. Silwood2]